MRELLIALTTALTLLAARNLEVNPMEHETSYDFTDEYGNLLYQEVRLPGKQFYVRRPDGRGGWIHNLDGVRRVLYGLPELRASTGPIMWVEGCKDVKTLQALGFTATTCALGVNGWRREFAQEFRDKYLIVLRDNDRPGLELRDRVVADSRPWAKRIVVVELPGVQEKGDISDWLDAGHTVEELKDLIIAAERDQAAASTSASAGAHQSAAPPAPGSAAPSGLPPFPDVAWDGPFDEYRGIVGPTTEASDSLHWAALCETIALEIGRRRYLCTPRPLYPSLYIIVIGPSGDARKSTALEYTEELWPLLGLSPEVISGLLSAEALFERLAGADKRALIFEDEFRTLLAAASRPGTRSLLPHLCRLARCPEVAELTRRGGVVRAERAFLCLLGATTPTAITAGLEDEAVSGGFLNRCLTIAGEPKKWLADPEPPPRDTLVAFAVGLKKRLDELRRGQAGRVELDRQAKDRWSGWYYDWRERRQKDYSEPQQQLTARTQDHARKIGLIYAVVRGHSAITLEDLEVGLAVADHCEQLTLDLLGGLILPRVAYLQERVLKILGEQPTQAVSRRALRQRVGGHYTREEFIKALDGLDQMGDVVIDRRLPARGPAGDLIRLA